MFDMIHEECGVFGIYSPREMDVVTETYMALYALQHRGQESCGIAVNSGGIITHYRDVGLVPDVFNRERLDSLGTGHMAIGHVRYATTAKAIRSNAQPLVVRHSKGNMALSYNGSLINAAKLREALEMNGAIFHTTNDTEVISYIITQERLTAPSIEEAVLRAMKRLEGACCLLVMSPRKLIAARDSAGFHPLCVGKLGESYVFSSESCALDSIGAEFIRDIAPGEIVVADDQGLRSIRENCTNPGQICVFEYIYTARPDSIIEGESVHLARKRAGAFLAKEHPVEADVVIGVPDSGLDAALGYAEESGIPYGIGFIKNRYIGRTFILPTQSQRERAVRIKLNVLLSTVKDKRVVMIDDSIVRGTTSARIVKMLRDAGAKEVHFRVSSPPFVNPCYFGTDIDSRDKLIACKYTTEEIRRQLGADSLGYLSLDAVAQIAKPTTGCGFCDGCFTGRYPIDVPGEIPKDKFTKKISMVKEKK
ncbi:MAG: amidophosphoribosyltransferase [Oscillospiraceae bacterium]|nr:amidophosphoribosyltransferase [Oscillospiraceae bacterium]MBQ8731308.1 amidophosphoribosyltransferase [Oscillospiraceae bacterium]